MTTYLYNSSKVKIGTIMGDTYRSPRLGSIHKFRLFDAWGIDVEAMKTLDEHKVKHIRILDKEDDIVYAITVEDFKNHSVQRNFGHEEQLFVSIKFFTQERAKCPVTGDWFNDLECQCMKPAKCPKPNGHG